MSQHRAQKGGWARRQSLPKGPEGRNLCRRCGMEVPKGRKTFCSDSCVHEWRLRTDPGYLRECCYRRDKGICALCRVNTMAGRRPGIRSGHLWHADHIVPVVEGGGECDLDNIRTLCVPCHKLVTAALRKRRAEIKKQVAAAGLKPLL